MPQNDGEVRVEITGDSSKIKKELKETESAVKNTAESISEMTDALEDTSGASNSFEDITENAENAEKAVAGVTNEANNFSESIEDVGNEAEKSGDKVSGFSKKLETISSAAKISVAAIAAIGAAMIKVTSDTAAYADNIDKASQKLGVSAEFYQEWEAVLQHSGTSMESMAFTFKTLANAAQDMSKDQQAAFEKLGISIQDVASLSAEDLFAQVISKLQQMEESTERTAIATDLLGRGAMEMGALLNTSAEDTQKMIDTVHELGGVMNNEAIKAGAAFQDNLQDLKTSLSGLKNDFVAEFLPSVNNMLTTANEKLPKLENTVKNIGKSISNVTDFAIKNHEAILSLITAYGTFYGTMKAGNAINAAVTAIKSLTTATKAAETATQAATAAQEANNAAAAANPYVLLASAIAAVTVGMISYANSVDSVHNRIKDVNKEVKELKKNTEESIESTEAEIAVFKDKAQQYEELREKASRTAGEEERLKELAEELQQYMPEGTQLIDEQTGAYSSLADSIDSVVEAMRRRATIAAYEDEYTELIKQQLEAQKNLDEAQERFKNFTENGGKVSANLFQNMAFTSLKKDLDDAAKTLADIEERKKELEIGMENFYEQEPKQQISAGETYAQYMRREGEKKLADDQKRRAEDLADYEKNLKSQVDALDKSLTLREISEEEYYKQLGEYLTKNQNLESDEYYKQLDRYNKYLDKKQDAADKAAEQQLKAEKTAAEKRQKEAEAAEKKAQQEAETAAKKAQQEAEKLLSEQEKTVEKSLSNIIKQFQKAYDEVEKKRENYKKKLLSIGGDIFSVDEIENPDGSKTKQYTINNIDEQIKKMRQYNADVAKLKKQGASSALLEELTSLSDSDSRQFASFLAGLTDEELAKINEAYEEKRRVADELSKEMYADEYAAIADGINTALDEVSAGAADKGKEAAESYVKAFGNTLLKHSENFYPLLGDEKYMKWFGNSGDTPNLFAGMSGDMEKLMKLFMGSNFADIAAKVTSTVRSEQARYSAPAYTAAVANTASDTVSATDSKRKSDIAAILEKLNKPLSIVLDGKVIAETVMTYQKNYMKGTGG